MLAAWCRTSPLDPGGALIVFVIRVAERAASHLVLAPQRCMLLLVDPISSAQRVIGRRMTSLLPFIGAGTLHGLGEVATAAESALILIVMHTLLSAHVLGRVDPGLRKLHRVAHDV